MKQFLCCICAACVFASAFAQNSKIEVATDKTTSLIFPCPIRHVDRGTPNILAEPVSEADNILLVKAASNNFPETNLSVVTADGSIYSFLISYGQADNWVHRIPAQSRTPPTTYAEYLLDNPKTISGIKDGSWDMSVKLTGIYVKDDVLYYQLELDNESTIDYDINFLRFYIRDKTKAKRTAVQEDELTPLYVAGNISRVAAQSHNSVVVVLNKFTIPEAKYLAIEMQEKNGGRNLLLKVNNRRIIKAISLHDLK